MAVDLKIRVDSKQAEAAIRKFAEKSGAEVQRLQKRTQQSTDKMTAAFKRVGTAIGAAFLARQAGGALLNFETAMAEVSTIVDTTSVNMSKLTKEVLRLSTGIPKSSVDLARGLYQTISAGVTDASKAIDVLNISSRAAVAGITDTKTSVDAITTILNAYQLETEDAVNVSDVFFTTIREGKTTFVELAASVGTVASSASLAGVTFEELGAAFATVTKAGISTEIAATALNNLFLTMANPTKQVKDATRQLGIEFSAAALRSKGFAQFIKELTEAFEGNEDAIFTLGLDMRAFRALSILGGTGASEFAKQLDNMSMSAGAMNTAFVKMNSTTQNTISIFINQFAQPLQEFAQETLPSIVNGFIKVIAALQVVGGTIQDFAVNIASHFQDGFFEGFKSLGKTVIEEIGELATAENVKSALFTTGSEAAEKFLDGFNRGLNQFEKLVVQRTKELTTSSTGLPAAAKSAKKITDNLLPASSVILPELNTQVDLFDDRLRSAEVTTEKLDRNSEELGRNFEAAANAVALMVSDLRGGNFKLSTILQAASFIPGPHQPFTAGAAAITSAFGFQRGTPPGGFVVPSGFPNDSFPIRVSSGERVQVTPANQTTNNNSTIQIIAPELTSIDDSFIFETRIMPRIIEGLRNEGLV